MTRPRVIENYKEKRRVFQFTWDPNNRALIMCPYPLEIGEWESREWVGRWVSGWMDGCACVWCVHCTVDCVCTKGHWTALFQSASLPVTWRRRRQRQRLPSGNEWRETHRAERSWRINKKNAGGGAGEWETLITKKAAHRCKRAHWRCDCRLGQT